MIRSIPKLRFDALAGYARQLGAFVISREIAWFEHQSGRVLGTLIQDRVDNDFGGILMGRDEAGRFRCVSTSAFCDSPQIASSWLKTEMESWGRRPDSDFAQGVAPGEELDLFKPIVSSNKLNPAFLRVATEEQFSPARELIEAMMSYYKDVDGNFVQQFQSSAFDARFWELYIFALLTEERFVFDRKYNAPDFVCDGLEQGVFVEAVTVGPTHVGSIVTEPLPPDDFASMRDYLSNYMPIKWGSALTSKLQKRYWELPHVKDNPIIFAIQDFHVPRSMTFTGSTLLPYLYGRVSSALYDEFGRLHVKSERIHEHRWRNKTIESGFFYLPGADWISAVIHNPNATISKFNRMARLAGMGSKLIKMIRFGTAYDDASPDAALPARFMLDVDDPTYTETWCEGLNVFHNPNARHPLAPGLFSDAMHHWLQQDTVAHTIPLFHPFSSMTAMIVPSRSGT